MFFEKNDTSFKEQVCTIALKAIFASSLVVSIFTALFSKALANALLGNEAYYGWILFCSLQIFISGIQTIISAPTRMQNKRKIYLVLSIINPLIGYGISIPIILFIDPLSGLVLGGFVSSLSQLAIFFWLNRRWFTHNEKNREITKELLKIGLPLVPVFLIYWVFHSCDRIMISQMLGLEQNGIYAIGSKASQISQLIYTAFAGGWQFFAFSTMKDNDHPHLIGKVWKRLFLVTTMSFIFVYSFRDSIFSLLFEGVYQKGSQVMPYLFICPLLLMLYQINGTQFQIVKKTYFSPIILTVGALLNIILNFVLIPVIGIKGAAFATLIGYICTLSLSIFITSKFHLIDIDRKTIFLYILFCIIILITIFDLTVLNISLFAIYTLICLIEVKDKARSVSNVIKYFFGGGK